MGSIVSLATQQEDQLGSGMLWYIVGMALLLFAIWIIFRRR